MRKLLALPIAAAALLLVAQQAQAATLSWTDDEGDAVTLVLPPEPTLDVIKTTLSSDGSALTWDTDLKEVAEGAPPDSLGYHFQLNFDVGDATFNVRFTEDPQNDKVVRLRTVDTLIGQISTQVTCDKCKGEINRSDKKVSVSVPIAELAALAASAHGDAVKIAAGTELAGVEVVSYRSAAALYFVADDSAAPDGGAFVL